MNRAGAVRWVGRILPGLALLFGAYVSLRYSLGLWHADPDIAVPVALWRGAQVHGLRFLTSWGYSPDNWLFSLVPFDALLLTIAPGHALLVVLSGWLIFLASAAIAGALLGQMEGRTAGWWLAAILSFANYQALGAAGFLSYPITHNISMLWALAALWLVARAFRDAEKRRALWFAAAAGGCLLVDSLSDPWAAVAITLPIAIVALWLGLTSWRTPQGRLALGISATALLAFAIARTRGFGALAFLPASPLVFTNADGVGANAGWVFRALAATANIVPGGGVESVPVIVVSGLACLALLGAGVALAIPQLRVADTPSRLTIGVAIVSIGIVTGAFLVGQWPRGLVVGRFFPNGYFFGGLIVGWVIIRSWREWPGLAKLAVGAYVALFAMAGVSSLPATWQGKMLARGNDDIFQIAQVLQREGLHYGYGPYWGSYALSMDWLTKGAVTIRPVTFRDGHISRRPGESSPYWYEAKDEPVGLRERFVFITNDGDECPVVADCVSEAVAQFGPPTRNVPYGDARILVWSAPLWPKLAQ